MAFNYDRYRAMQAYPLVYQDLITAARYRGTMTYQEVAQIMGLPLSGQHMSREVGNLLGAIVEVEHAHGRPMLSAVVTNIKGVVTDGFFVRATDLGRLQDDSSEGRARFLEAERQAVYKTWQRSLREPEPTEK